MRSFLTIVVILFSFYSFAGISISLNPEGYSQIDVERFYDHMYKRIKDGNESPVCYSKYKISCDQQIALYLKALDQYSFDIGSAELQKKFKLRAKAWGYTPEKILVSAVPDKNSLTDLYFAPKSLQSFAGGRYQKVPQIYMFCSENRKYPCRLILKDKNGKSVYGSDGKLWNLSNLAYSRRKKKYNEFNGNTPAGVYTVDSVMPEANKRIIFGKFRRLILNFISKSNDSEELKKLLPASSHNLSWWQESVVARDMGRNYLRIHGTGMKNTNKKSPHYGLYGTSGCVASRENRYDGIDYRDQRLLLDKLMEVSDMEQKFENETRIRALLYVVNIKNVDRAINLEDLKEIGIF